MVDCWAYKDEKSSETYEKHILDIAKYMEESNYFNGLVRVLSKRLNVDQDEIHDLVLLAGVLHDIGKIDVTYQRNPNRFSGHEIKSAGIISYASKIPENLFDPSDSEPVTKELLISIIIIRPVGFHHYAQRDYTKICKNLKSSFIPYDSCIECVKGVNDEVKNRFIRSKLGKEIIDKITNIISKKNKLDLYLPIEFCSNDFSYRYYRFVSSAILSILNEADGTVARINREAKQ
ncbi:HD domain-containing protein [Sulfolobus tengchongensis]|uniref:HD domain-containing protein n=1 Tax=Sulfolobus tengchongensis TaxID=207809 RepID=A0AAX4L385_9CREN